MKIRRSCVAMSIMEQAKPVLMLFREISLFRCNFYFERYICEIEKTTFEHSMIYRMVKLLLKTYLDLWFVRHILEG